MPTAGRARARMSAMPPSTAIARARGARPWPARRMRTGASTPPRDAVRRGPLAMAWPASFPHIRFYRIAAGRFSRRRYTRRRPSLRDWAARDDISSPRRHTVSSHGLSGTIAIHTVSYCPQYAKRFATIAPLPSSAARHILSPGFDDDIATCAHDGRSRG